ncbi:MAG TPA: hypothetical protein VLH08_15415 [Acidobacteriota bacterium]|nr:hypothetical protein [Acidobacteriota bacterium]
MVNPISKFGMTVIVVPPAGAIITTLPAGCTTRIQNEVSYSYVERLTIKE